MKETDLQKATHEGTLNINGIEIRSYVLEDGTRLLSRIDFLRAMGRTGKAKGGRKYDEEFKTPVFLSAKNLKPFIDNNLIENSESKIFKDLKGVKSIGYKAELLPSVCYVFVDAFEKNSLNSNQKHIHERCKILLRGFATVGIIALVDEVTGYQEVRTRKALQEILEKFIAKELRPWVKTFPDEFYENYFRLRGWQYQPLTLKRPSVVGKDTNDIIYDRLAPGVRQELVKLTPKDEKGRLKQHLHRRLTEDIGHPKLREHIASVITLMKVTSTWNGFVRLLERALPKYGETYQIPFNEDEMNK